MKFIGKYIALFTALALTGFADCGDSGTVAKAYVCASMKQRARERYFN